ncbi:hypothetical protein [Actibacterium lipolyticum]|uniref:DUF4177 domain-containing protein n=1 Tax=Actibacterium lipolyticum TaxID=1524263 RepID=A0A238KUK7_9RHOB|nr:hypothetical protein [Actibacterium lipolyticum]SMX46397.1 hypothetical protein COL8621_03095 [Actibacterium lipolyticum]
MNTRILLPVGLAFALLAAPASAACYADYKAKQNDPLRLHYGVIELPDKACGARSDAAGVIERRIASDGWKLLNVMSIFGQDGLAERKESAGKFFLRY